VYAYFKIWREVDEGEKNLLEQALKNQVSEVRVKLERNASPRFLIVDVQSVKNSETAGSKDYGAGKKVSGIKRQLAGDTPDLPDVVAIMTVGVSDRKGAEAAFV
jgi:hypothetical protein